MLFKRPRYGNLVWGLLELATSSYYLFIYISFMWLAETPKAVRISLPDAENDDLHVVTLQK